MRAVKRVQQAETARPLGHNFCSLCSMTWQFPMVGVITLALMITLARYQLQSKAEVEERQEAKKREEAHVVGLIS